MYDILIILQVKMNDYIFSSPTIAMPLLFGLWLWDERWFPKTRIPLVWGQVKDEVIGQPKFDGW